MNAVVKTYQDIKPGMRFQYEKREWEVCRVASEDDAVILGSPVNNRRGNLFICRPVKAELLFCFDEAFDEGSQIAKDLKFYWNAT